MKKIAIVFAAAALALAGCNRHHTDTTPSFAIRVNLANADGETLYLQQDGQVLDSAVIENWDAVFTTATRDDNEMYALMLKGWRRPFAFFADNHDVELEGDAQNPNAIVVKGSESQARLDAFTKGFQDIDAQIDSIAAQINAAKETGDEKLVEELKNKRDDAQVLQKMYCFDYVWEHPTDATAHYVLYRYKWAFEPCELRTLVDNIHHADSTLTTGSLRMMEEYLAKQERVQAGQPLIDFTQNDTEGNPVTLSQFAQGKLLLVDFWASWCPDCRKENPNVVTAYNRFHAQGFDVLGVSFDTDREKWLAAIEKDGLGWTHVSDLQGWSNAAGALYSVAFIPQNALIKDGMIVARNLEGDELMAEIERQLQ